MSTSGVDVNAYILPLTFLGLPAPFLAPPQFSDDDEFLFSI